MTTLQIITVGVAVLWFAIQAAMRYWPRRTVAGSGTPVDGPGAEPPAIVNLAVNGWLMTDDAITATIVDLAARGVLTFGSDAEKVTIHVPEVIPTALRPYEQTLLLYLRSRAEDGVVLAETLQDRPVDAYDQFLAELSVEARSYKTLRRWSGRQRAVLIFTSLPPAVLAVSLVSWSKPADVYFGRWIALGVLWWVLCLFALRGLDARPTQAGAELTARSVSYREFLGASPGIITAQPADVDLWGRELAYAAAFGLAEVTLWLVPAGEPNRAAAWSNHQGRWQKIKIWYPWLLGWGRAPGRRALHGVWKLVLGVAVLFVAQPTLFGASPVSRPTGVPTTVALVALAAGGLDFTLLVVEGLTRRTRTGVLLRHSLSKQADFYVALRDGDSPSAKAYIVRRPLVRGGSQTLKRGTTVELTCGSGIGWVTHIKTITIKTAD